MQVWTTPYSVTFSNSVPFSNINFFHTDFVDVALDNERNHAKKCHLDAGAKIDFIIERSFYVGRSFVVRGLVVGGHPGVENSMNNIEEAIEQTILHFMRDECSRSDGGYQH